MRCVAQYGANPEDLPEFLPQLTGYLNAGYSWLAWYWDKRNVGPTDDCHPPLRDVNDTPELPVWTHDYICDYATYLIYRNGNPQRQQRGIPFLSRWQEGVEHLRAEGGKAGVPDRFRNLYVFEPSPPPSKAEWQAEHKPGSKLGSFSPFGE